MIIVTYKGKGLSTNQAYSGGWQQRYTKTEKLKAEFRSLLLEHKHVKIEEFELILNYNGRFDIDNTVATIKIFIDSMRDMGNIPEDNKRHFKKLTVKQNINLPKPTFEFTVKSIYNDNR